MAPKKTMEQSQMSKLNPALHTDPIEKSRYELATFRAARKRRSPSRAKGMPGVKKGGK